MEVPELATLLRETEEYHGAYESTHGPHKWWDWYAAHIDARQGGAMADEAAAAAARYVAA
jgi:hypothetical protein